jgi:hypothetical protein
MTSIISGVSACGPWLRVGIIFDRFYSLMAKDGFTEVQQKLEAIALELKNENDPDRRRTLLKK